MTSCLFELLTMQQMRLLECCNKSFWLVSLYISRLLHRHLVCLDCTHFFPPLLKAYLQHLTDQFSQRKVKICGILMEYECITAADCLSS